MKQELKAVSFYGLSLLDGCYEGFEKAGGYSLSLKDGAGSYITQMFDTGEEGCSYNRLVVEAVCEGVKLEVIAAASDESFAVMEDKLQSLERRLQSTDATATEKAGLLKALPHVRAVNTQDILLHSLRGRYVWIYLAATPALSGVCSCELSGLRLELPKVSFTEYFPEIYRGNDFFDRYIAVFQSLFLDAERQVDDVPRLLDYRTTPDENVEYLAGWLGIENSRKLFTPAQLRHIIANIDVYQGAKGTKRAMESIITLYTGLRPRIVEPFEWMRPELSGAQLALYQKLYGDTADCFCVILDLTGQKHRIDENALSRIIGDYSPLGAQCRLVLLTHCCQTDTHCYLGVNSALSAPETASIGFGALGEDILIG